MRVALAAEGTRGDVYPLLALGERIRARGGDAVVCAPPDFRADAEERGFAFRPVGIDTRAYLTEKAHSLTRGFLPMMREAHRYLRDGLDRQFAALPDAVAGCDLVVGAGVQIAAPSVAALHGLPYRYVAYCPALLPSQEHGPATLPFQSLPPWGNRLLWRALFAFYEVTIGRQVNARRARLGMPPARGMLRYLLGERPILAADAALAPLPSDCPLPVVQTPCLHPFEGEPLPPKLEAFLDAGSPPVYLGFGSMTDPDPARTTRAILDCVTRLGRRAIVSEGWAGLGRGPLPEGVFATGPVAHARLFPRVAVVVHHGGAGTTTTAARAGVPQVIVPHVMDQFYWVKRLQALGVAPPPLPRKRLRAERLAALVAEIVDNELVADRARELGARLRDDLAATPDPVDLL